MTPTQAIIWRYIHEPGSIERSEFFCVRLLNPTNNSRHPLPLGLLVPTSAEPALLIVMPTTGKIAYWESLSSAATVDFNRQKQQSIHGTVSGMTSREVVTKMTEAEPRGFVLTFNTGRLAHLVIIDAQGKPSISTQFLRNRGAQSSGIFGSLKDVFTSGGWRKDVAAVRAGKSMQRGQRYVLVATTKGNFQQWDLSWNGTHALVHDLDAKRDLLKALLEGGEVFHDQQEHDFELLDFTLLPSDAPGKQLSKQSVIGDCRLLALTVLKGVDSSKYALIGLTIANGSISIDVVHPIICYTTPLLTDSQFRPQIMVPEPGQTAIVALEKSVILVSLVEIEQTPSSQLHLEAHALPDPFQDVIDIQQSKPYRIVGCAVEPYHRHTTQSSCIIMIYGFGMIRVTALPMREDQSALDRASVNAQTKIEQAVFYGNVQQDLLDFAPRPETTFTTAEVEKAALNVSHSIASSTSRYLPAITPSMEQQLSKRAVALFDLNQHLRKHYPLVSPPVRWQLLWTAEKMAAARVLWRCYNAAITDPIKGPKDVFAEMVEAIPEYRKQENQPDSGETDGVRHWFTHDIWRLEWVVPYSHKIIELLFTESCEDQREFDRLTKAKMISDAVDIQLIVLETAFRFRQENAAAYGLDAGSMTDGVLQTDQDFQGLPAFWTSSANVIARVKELVDVSREMAKLLASDLEDYMTRQGANEDIEEPHEDIDTERAHELMMKLAKSNPRQIQICCQTFIERFRWLKSRDEAKLKADGESLTKAHYAIRKNHFIELIDLEMTEEAIRLAEKYWDMEALVEILERENDNPEIAPSIPGRVNSYFFKFGARWADAYFTRHLKRGEEAVDILSNNGSFKKHLTRYLRQHPSYANTAWINEISTERDYTRAAISLKQSSEQERNVWNQKIMLSMGKLSILAAKSKDQVKPKAADPEIRRIDHNVAILGIQESLDEFMRLNVVNALDDQARVDLAMERYGNEFVKGKPSLERQLQRNLQNIFRMETLPPHDIIDTLTLLNDDSFKPDLTSFISTRFFLALKILKLASARTSTLAIHSPPSPLMAKIIWRRVLISSDWTKINRTESKNDKQVSRQTDETALFRTLFEGYYTLIGPEDKPFWDTTPLFSPSEILGAGTTLKSLRNLPQYATTSDSVLADLAKDLSTEDHLLRSYIDEGRLEGWYKGILERAKTAAREKADKDGEERVKKSEAEMAVKGRLEEKDKEKHGNARWEDDESMME